MVEWLLTDRLELGDRWKGDREGGRGASFVISTDMDIREDKTPFSFL